MAARSLGIGAAVLLAAGLLAGTANADRLLTPAASEPVLTASPTPTASLPEITPAPPTPAPTITATPAPSRTPAPTLVPTSAPTIPPATGPMAPRIYSGSRDARVIALTIDDCFSDAVTLEILGILREQQVNATFFPIGRAMPDSADVWRTVAAAGFPIANHTWSHKDLTTLTFDQIVADIRLFDTRVAAMTGQPVLPVVRPYAGNWNETVLRAAAAAGKRAVVMWDTAFGDTGSGGVVSFVWKATRGHSGSIVLMHANRESSAQALPAVIAYYRSHGYQFVTIGQLLGLGGSVPYGPYQAPTATPSPTPSPTPTPAPTASPSPTPSPTPTPEPTALATAAPVPPTPWVDTYGLAVVLALAGVATMGVGAGWYLRRH